MSCKDPSCVNLDNLYNKQRETLFENGGQQIGKNRWWLPAHSANYTADNRTKHDIDHVVIHSAEGYTGGLRSFSDPDRKASAHYAVGWDGTVVQMVNDKDMAWHAGRKGSTGIDGMNERSIGIEHVGFAHAMWPGSETEWSKDLLNASAKLVAELARKYDIPIDRDHIIPHAIVDPERRSDPGPYWPWDWYIRRIKWYYRRPYVYGAIGVTALVGIVWWATQAREKKRIERWKRI